jgi:tRNA(Ile)-lysidine synthase
LKRHRIKWREDLSNRSLRYRRNYIRHKLLPALKDALNPAVERAILNLADTLGEEEVFLEAAVDRMAQKCLTVTVGGKFCLALERFRPYAVGLRRRLLRRCLKATWQSDLAPDKEVVARLDRMAAEDSGALSLPGQIRAEIAGGLLYLFRTGRSTVRATVEPGQRCRLDWPSLTLSARLHDREAVRLVKRARARQVLMDWDRMEPPLVIRSVKPGDRFRPLGMKGAKKIGDYLTDRKVPRPLRDETLVLCDRQGPIWLLGFEIADRVKIVSTTRKVLSVGYTIRKPTRGETV